MKKKLPQVIPDWLIECLPNYEKIEAIPQAFSDSTHQLWRLQDTSEDHRNHFLKVCHNTESPFWLIMHDLFDFDLRIEIADFADTYNLIDKVCSLAIPELIKAEAPKNGDAYILTSELEGKTITSVDNDKMVQQLAKHLAELHLNSLSHTKDNHWGSLTNPKFKASDWPLRLATTLKQSSEKWGGVFLHSDKYLKQALATSALIKTNDFVAMIPDLRWDQFLQNDNRISALIDLDAFVLAPRELDFVILEYLLTADQLRVFSDKYSKYQVVPKIKEVRPAYRLLLFYMQILGENDLAEWMEADTFF